MNKARALLTAHWRLMVGVLLAAAILSGLLLYKLGSLVGGLSAPELQARVAAVGWHGIYHSPLYLPLKLGRSVVFFLSPNHGQFLTRLPNALFGGLTIISFGFVIKLWHSSRIALLTTVLFATSAWLLHVSRLASYDVMYLWASVSLLLVNGLIYRYHDRASVLYGSAVLIGLLLYIPGLIWLVLIDLFLLRRQVWQGLKRLRSFWKLGALALLSLAWLPLLIKDLTRPGELRLWLGLPTHFASLGQIGRHFLAVPWHLFVRGPLLPNVWLGRSMVLDVFTLTACLIGIYFYATHLKAGRSRLLLALSFVGWLLVGLGGPLSLSLLVPLLYVVAATGIAYLLHDWLQVFPHNPLARNLGFVLIGLAISLACVYNLRAYFLAWPHNAATRTTFHYHL